MTACGSKNDDSGLKNEESESLQLYLDINFEENIILNRYDVYAILDDEKLDEIKHGKYYTKLCEVDRGDHVIEFENTEKPSVKASKTITIEEDTTYKCTIHTDGDEIVIKDEEIISGVENSDLEMPNMVGTNLETALKQLESLGYVNVKAKANDDRTIILETNWVVIEQSVPENTKIDKNQEIILTCKKETELFGEKYKGLELVDAKRQATEEGFKTFYYFEDYSYTDISKILADISDEDAKKWIVTDASKFDDDIISFSLSYDGEITVPNVVGDTVKEAKKALRKEYVFNIKTEDPDNLWVYDDENWKVTAQSINAGEIIQYSDKIILTCREITDGEKEDSDAVKKEKKEEDKTNSKKVTKKKAKKASKKKKPTDANKAKLKTYIGQAPYSAISGIRAIGYKPKFIAANTQQDMTSQIEYEGASNESGWIIASLSGINEDRKVATYIVTSQWMRDNLY